MHVTDFSFSKGSSYMHVYYTDMELLPIQWMLIQFSAMSSLKMGVA